MPYRKSKALACYLLRTTIMFFLYKRTVIGIEYPEFHVIHFRTLVGFICPSERYRQASLILTVMNIMVATCQQAWDA